MARQLLPDVAAFITSIYGSLSEGTPDDVPGMLISRPGEGTLFLDAEDADSYRKTVGGLTREFARAGDLSRRSIEKALQDALFEALDIRQEERRPFDERLSAALIDLRKTLTRGAIAYKCFLPIHGLSPSDLPLVFGGIRFVAFGEPHRRELLKPLGRDTGSIGDDLKREMLWGRPCAVVQVMTRDYESAEMRARTMARAAIDCMNFFHDLIRFNHGWLYLPSEHAAEMDVAPIISAEGRVTLRSKRVGPLLPFSIQSLRRQGQVLTSWKSVSALLRTSASGTVGERLLASIRWAGRASVEPIREQSFLLFAIALESAVLPEQAEELNYRLSLRVSRLAGGDRAHRSEVKRSVRGLYKVRSKIVHSGFYEVTDEDLGRLRWLTKVVLLRLLRKRRLWNQPRKQLEEWLDSLTDR